jgi:hypothetical protein
LTISSSSGVVVVAGACSFVAIVSSRAVSDIRCPRSMNRWASSRADLRQ